MSNELLYIYFLVKFTQYCYIDNSLLIDNNRYCLRKNVPNKSFILLTMILLSNHLLGVY